MRIPMLVLALSALSLAACATTRMGDQERLALYDAHSGAPVKTIRYTSPMGWERIDDEHLVLNMRPNEAWLLTVPGPCLDWGSAAPVVSVSHQASIVSAGLDRISVPGVPVPCRITQIRPVDLAGLRAARDARDALAAKP
jgi:hypothetical protein